ADLTVTRLAHDTFLIVTSAAASTHDTHWIRRHLGEARAVLTEVTSSEAVLGVMGPRSRELLTRLTRADLSNAAFPFLSAREIWLASGRGGAARVTYAGGLGWSSTCPPSLPAASTTRWSRRVKTWGCATRAITRWTRCAWRRRTAPGDTTSAARTRRSRPGS